VFPRFLKKVRDTEGELGLLRYRLEQEQILLEGVVLVTKTLVQLCRRRRNSVSAQNS